MSETLELEEERVRPVHNGRRTETLPMMRGSVLLHTLRFTLDPEGYFAGAQRRHGDMFTLRILGQRWVALAHPEAVRELFSHRPDEVDSGEANQALSPVLGTRNLLLLDRE